MGQLNYATKNLLGNIRKIGSQSFKVQDFVNNQFARFIQHKIRLRFIVAWKTRALQRQHILPEAFSERPVRGTLEAILRDRAIIRVAHHRKFEARGEILGGDIAELQVFAREKMGEPFRAMFFLLLLAQQQWCACVPGQSVLGQKGMLDALARLSWGYARRSSGILANTSCAYSAAILAGRHIAISGGAPRGAMLRWVMKPKRS